MTAGCSRDHDALCVNYAAMTQSLAIGAHPVVAEAARTALLVSADLCGFRQTEPLLVWAKRRVETYRKLHVCCGRELDAAVSAMPRDELNQIFGGAA